MKRLAILFITTLIFNIGYSQDTLSVSESSSGSESLLVLIAVIIAVALYIMMNKRKKYKVLKLKEEERKELAQFLKDKSLPFFKVKGMTQYDIKKPGGYIAELVSETDNPYDKYAVAVVHSRLGIIGYLPKGNHYIYDRAKNEKILGAVEIGIARNGYPYGKFWLDPSIFAEDDIAQMKNLDIDDNLIP